MKKVFVPTEGVESWRKLLADPKNQWPIGYSARTLAHCWEAAQATPHGLPPEIAALFGPTSELLIAIPEHKVALGDAGRESQSDVFALIKTNDQVTATAVEGKVNESFGPTIGAWLLDASSGKRARLKFLCELLGLAHPPPDSLHYQLLHRTASAILEADRFNADGAAMIVHSFSKEKKWHDAYLSFLALFGLKEDSGKLVSTTLRGRPLHFGWAVGEERFLES